MFELTLIGLIIAVIGIVQLLTGKHRQALISFILANSLLCINGLLLGNFGFSIFNGAVALYALYVYIKHTLK